MTREGAQKDTLRAFPSSHNFVLHDNDNKSKLEEHLSMEKVITLLS